MTINTRASMAIARADITAGLLERKLSWLYVLQTATRKTLPVLKEAMAELWLFYTPWATTREFSKL
jgi:hypothetical protein